MRMKKRVHWDIERNGYELAMVDNYPTQRPFHMGGSQALILNFESLTLYVFS